MPQQVRRILVEKKPGFDVEAQSLCRDLQHNLGITALENVRLIHRYDMAGISDAVYNQAKQTIFAEPPVDFVYDQTFDLKPGDRSFAVEFLPGQYDQRADSAMQCIQLLTQAQPPVIRSAKVIVLEGRLEEKHFTAIKEYCINPVEAREAAMDIPDSLDLEWEKPAAVKTLTGFIALTEAELSDLKEQLGLAMSEADLAFCQQYFKCDEKRDPTITEIRVIDTYWSDHCRHTTFHTKLTGVEIQQGRYTKPVEQAYRHYQEAREYVYGKTDRDISLMDIATIGMKQLKKQGLLADLDESEEVNAASIVVPVDIDGRTEEWLVMFKNETHNHPTEIEPFGGAATCLGGAIRDPLSGRSYVYQAMRVTGSGDPRTKIEDTLPGKLPQRKITVGAAQGYSSYGNQIGLATGQVAEIYDEGFIAKRMEIGAVVAAAPRNNVRRISPVAGDVVLLVGGRTGRDGCGGATGSSKEHTVDSLASCGAEVQKGNAPTERKIQRLFRQPEAARLIKRCNDFGAGGVAVAIGELTDGLEICLDAVPKKYEGLDGTELAISESQERMAVVVAAADADRFCALADKENLEVTNVATVTDTNRLVMLWREASIVNLSRDFLNTNGVKQTAQAVIAAPNEAENYFALQAEFDRADLKAAWLANLRDLNVCSQKGLVERFDSTIGAGTVIMPFGGKHQLTPAEGMAAKIPVLSGETTTVTTMAYGYSPRLAKWSPFHGALYAVVESVVKTAALGADYRRIRLTLQEYFEKLGTDRTKWGKPLSALLGALYAGQQLGIAAIGGKDSMSGTFMELNVPPTLVSFALAPAKAGQILSPEFKNSGSLVVLLALPRDSEEMPCFATLHKNLEKVSQLAEKGKLLAAQTVRTGGIAAAISKMTFGNRIGFVFQADYAGKELFCPEHGSIILEVAGDTDIAEIFGDVDYQLLGKTTSQPAIIVADREIPLDEATAAWQQPLEEVFPVNCPATLHSPCIAEHSGRSSRKPLIRVAKPRVLIPVFPGTNCEYDSARAFAAAGAETELLVFRNLTASAVQQSINELARQIGQSQIVMLPGGFSAGDEPEGSGKFIAAVFRNPQIKEAVASLLEQRDGLMLGICNGFQALIKLGLVPYGRICEMTETSPTLTYNAIGRHVSTMVQTKIVSTLSPWFAAMEVGDIHTVPVSHGEGRFTAPPEIMEKLITHGQVAAQYVDFEGNATYTNNSNPNQSFYAVEALTSPDGRVLGKMAHSERVGSYIAKNVPGTKEQALFKAGVRYFQ